MDNYIRYHWCKEVRQQPSFQDLAIEALNLMGVQVSDTADGAEICKKMTETACQLTSGSCDEDSVMIQCGDVKTCEPLATLVDRLSEDKKYSARFSQNERRKVGFLHMLLNETNLLPCVMFSDTSEMCSSNGMRCIYHVHKLWKNIWEPQARAFLETSCFIQDDYIKDLLSNDTYSLGDYKTATFDVLMRQAHLFSAFSPASETKTQYSSVSEVFDGSLRAIDWTTYRNQTYEAVQNTSMEDLHKILSQSYKVSKPENTNSEFVASNMLILGEFIVNLFAHYRKITVVDFTQLVQLTLSLKLPTITGEKARTMAYILNAATVSTMVSFLPWSYTLLVSYVGHEQFLEVILDPVCLGMLNFFMWYSGIPSDFTFGPMAKLMCSIVDKSFYKQEEIKVKVNNTIAKYNNSFFSKSDEPLLDSISDGVVPWFTSSTIFSKALYNWQHQKLVVLNEWGFLYKHENTRTYQQRTKQTNQLLGVTLTSYWWKFKNLGINSSHLSTFEHIASILKTR